VSRGCDVFTSAGLVGGAACGFESAAVLSAAMSHFLPDACAACRAITFLTAKANDWRSFHDSK
jgi:hypothetical protein